MANHHEKPPQVKHTTPRLCYQDIGNDSWQPVPEDFFALMPADVWVTGEVRNITLCRIDMTDEQHAELSGAG